MPWRMQFPVFAISFGALSGTAAAVGLSLIASAMLGGCASFVPTKVVATAVELEQSKLKAPIPAQCDPKDRNQFPTVKKVPGATPAKNLAHAFTTAKSRDARNEERETVCFCQSVRDHGSDAEKKVHEAACAKVWWPQDQAAAAPKEKPTS